MLIYVAKADDPPYANAVTEFIFINRGRTVAKLSGYFSKDSSCKGAKMATNMKGKCFMFVFLGS